MGSWSPDGSFYGDNGEMRHGGDCSGTLLFFKEGWACDGCEAGDDYPDNELAEVETVEDLAVYWTVPGRQEIEDFVWDTSLPELDEPWPHHMPEQLGLRQMVSWLTGRPDVTSYLYDLAELERYQKEQDGLTVLMEAVRE